MARLGLDQLQFMKHGSKRLKNDSFPSDFRLPKWLVRSQNSHIEHDVCPGTANPRSKCGLLMSMPHCDQRVLHAPGQCIYCDGFPELQKAREMWGINYTGQYDPEKLPCPAEVERGIDSINKWGGNQAG